MNTLARLYAFQKVSSLQEAVGYGAAGAGVGALGAGAHGLYTGNRDLLRPAKDNLARTGLEEVAADRRLAEARRQFASDAGRFGWDPKQMAPARDSVDSARSALGAAKVDAEAARNAVGTANTSTLKRAGKRAAGGALALGTLGAGIGLFS